MTKRNSSRHPALSKDYISAITKLQNISTSFISQDGVSWENWDLSSRLYDHFFIVGPKSWGQSEVHGTLFEYPPLDQGKEFMMEKFCFPSGYDYKNIQFEKPSEVSDLLWNSTVDSEEIVFIRSTNNSSGFIYSILFRITPLTMPSPCSSAKFEDVEFFISSKTVPSCLAALCFVSVHPFFDLFYELLRDILTTERVLRQHSQNIQTLVETMITGNTFSISGTTYLHDIYDTVLKRVLDLTSPDLKMVIESIVKELRPHITNKAVIKRMVSRVFRMIEEDGYENPSPHTDWPNQVSPFMVQFLEALYTIPLPSFGELMSIRFPLCKEIIWKTPHYDDIDNSMLIWSSQSLLHWIELDDFINLVSLVLLQATIVVTGDNISEISRTVSSLPLLISPFKWTSPIVTLCPREMSQMIHSPVPIIIGMIESFLPEEAHDLVLINVDNKTISYGSSELLLLPEADSLRELLEFIWEKRQSGMSSSVSTIFRIVEEHISNTLKMAMIQSVIRRVSETGPTTSTFIEEVFKITFMDEDRDFINLFMQTQTFTVYKEQLCLDRSKDYDDEAEVSTISDLSRRLIYNRESAERNMQK